MGALVEASIEEGVKLLLSTTAKQRRFRIDVPMPPRPSGPASARRVESGDLEAEREAEAEAEAKSAGRRTRR